MSTRDDAIAAIFAIIDNRYADPEQRTKARAAAKRIVNETSSLADVAARYHEAQARRDAAMAELNGAVIAAVIGEGRSENSVSKEIGITRVTVRSMFGKRN